MWYTDGKLQNGQHNVREIATLKRERNIIPALGLLLRCTDYLPSYRGTQVSADTITVTSYSSFKIVRDSEDYGFLQCHISYGLQGSKL